MDDAVTRLFNQFDNGKISRRQLFQTLGLAAVAVPLTRVLGQGSCGGARAGTAACDTTSWKAPFDTTGWSTVALDHFTMQATDYQREAAYYNALMGWKVRSDDGQQAMLDIGDFGAVAIRGGYQAPPPPPAPPVTDSAAGGGRGGRGGRGGGRAPRHVAWDGVVWGIAPWDAKKVEAELKKRGLDPVANHGPNGYESFMFKDPEGFQIGVSNGGPNRRKGDANAKLSAAAPFESTGWKTVWLDHISYQVSNYKRTAAFYQALLGWHPTGDEGSQNEMEIGQIGNVIMRGANANDPARGGTPGATGPGEGRGNQAPARPAQFDHISFGITPWDADAVKAELDKRGLNSRADTGGRGEIHTAQYQSYHTTTPDGFDLQISNSSQARRTVR